MALFTISQYRAVVVIYTGLITIVVKGRACLMSSTAMDRQNWEEFLKDGVRLREEYEKLVSKIKELEATKVALEEKLRASEAQHRELQLKLSSIATTVLREPPPSEKQFEVDSKGLSEVKELRSQIGRVIKQKET